MGSCNFYYAFFNPFENLIIIECEFENYYSSEHEILQKRKPTYANCKKFGISIEKPWKKVRIKKEIAYNTIDDSDDEIEKNKDILNNEFVNFFDFDDMELVINWISKIAKNTTKEKIIEHIKTHIFHYGCKNRGEWINSMKNLCMIYDLIVYGKINYHHQYLRLKHHESKKIKGDTNEDGSVNDN